MENIFEAIIFGLVVMVVLALLAFIIGFFVMLLWNWLMPSIFGLREITYIEGWGLAVLSSFLFKSTMKH